MTPTALLLAVPLLSVTCLLALGCVGTALLHHRPDAATRVQRAALLGVFLAAVVFASIASVPRARQPLVPALTALAPPASATAFPSVVETKVSPPPAIALGTASSEPETVTRPKLAARPAMWLPQAVERALLLIWAVGSVASIGYLLHGHLALTRLHGTSRRVADETTLAETRHAAQLAQTGVPDLRLHPADGGPLLAGIRAPTLYLPAILPPDPTLRQMLFLHEMTHLRRGDVRYLLLSRALCALLWWHPLAHLLARQMEQTAEAACDLRAASEQNRPHAPMYAQFLLTLATRDGRAPSSLLALTSAIATPRSHVGRRITRLLGAASDDAPPSRPLRFGIAAAASLLVLGGGAIQSSLSASAPPDPPADYVPTPGQFETEFAAGRNKTGALTADVQIIEFSDFECPSCRRANNPAPSISRAWRTAWPNVRVQFRHHPILPLHPLALRAAIAAERHGQNGRFWKAHDHLFQGRSLTAQLSAMEKEKGTLVTVGEDGKAVKFTAPRVTPQTSREVAKALEQIRRDETLGRQWAVNETPTYFVRNRRDNTIRRFVGQDALRAYLFTTTAKRPLSPPPPAQTNKPRVTMDVRNASLDNTLRMFFQTIGANYVVDPSLKLPGVFVTFQVTDMDATEALKVLQSASPVPFEVEFLDEKNAIVKPASGQ